jgi:predicted  nucleic acid-binding Zn-ribbon protein
MSLQDAFDSLTEFLNNLDEEAEHNLALSHALVIICPDCGKNVAFRNRCPKCGGDSWIPAGHAGGIFERMKVHRWRERMRDEDLDLAEASAPARESADEDGEKRTAQARSTPEPS